MGIFEAKEAEGEQLIIKTLFISHRCPKCFEMVTLIQLPHRDGQK